MPKRKVEEEFAPLGEKDSWHSYGLQVLSPTRFAKVVGNILSGRYLLLTSKLKERDQNPLYSNQL